MTTAKFKGLLFDLDGTLLDTTELIVESFKHAFRHHYQREVDIADVHAFFGKPLRDAMEYLGPEKVDELITTYREHNLAHHDNLARVFLNVPETIQTLYNEGIAMAIVTSKTASTALRGLRLFGLDKYFPVIIGFEQCSKHKPNPEPVLLALENLGLEAEECLMVGDSPFDILSAKRAGVKTAAVKWTYVPWNCLMAEEPDYTLDTMKDLLHICEINK